MQSAPKMKKTVVLPVVIVLVLSISAVSVAVIDHSDDSSPTAEELPVYTITGETDLPGNFFISFVFSKNIIMLDGKGDVVWYKHGDPDPNGVPTGYWDFKKHIIGDNVYYSYHDQNGSYDKYGIEGYAPGDRVIMDSDFREIKRIDFEESPTVEQIYQGHPLDGHDFLLIDLDHYIMSGYVKDTVYNVPGYPGGSSVVYSYLQEVYHGNVVWEWKSIDYQELYSLTVEDAEPTADDFGNIQTDAPDYVHFNAMRLNDDGDLVCSFRHLNTVLCLDRTRMTDQIKWKLSGNGDDFNLTADQKSSSQHYVTVDGDRITVFDNHNITGETCVRIFTIDTGNMTAAVSTHRIEGKFSSACGSAQLIHDNVYMLGWGRTENDAVCLCVYDFDEDRELIRMTLDNPSNFTYRCVYYE